MPIIVNTLPNASTNVNGIEFARHESGHMHSVAPVECSMLDVFLAIPGFHLHEPVPAITGTVAADGAMKLDIPMRDGSVLNLQATGPGDASPVLQATEGDAAKVVAAADAANAAPAAPAEPAAPAAPNVAAIDAAIAAAGKPGRKTTAK